MKKSTRLIAIVCGLLAPVLAQANILSYQFTVTATSGPLNGTSSTGTFSFDRSIIPSGGGRVSQTGLLTDLDFTWNGITYDETTANTGDLFFDTLGNLYSFLFGNNCFGGFNGCGAGPFSNDWIVDTEHFIYATPTSVGGSGTVTFSGPITSAPEPTSLALFGLGLAGLIGYRRR